ncbi:MAG: hypothetical protein HC789_14620 [Microcoleus sp. CSU_2_2]|nr:hypothetical protein [Microcoleus sp. CSU_2_2]
MQSMPIEELAQAFITALWNVETHLAVMDVFRQWYRAQFVEPAIVMLFICQIVTIVFSMLGIHVVANKVS